MMKKLYKWDLIHYFNQLKWIVLGTLFIVGLSEVFKIFMDKNLVWALFYQTAFIISIIGIIMSAVYAFFSIFQRYYHTILKDEAYFTHTLPIKKGNILLSKVLSGFTLLILILLFTVGLFIIIDVIDIQGFLELRQVDDAMFQTIILSLTSMVIMFLVFIVVIYAAMSFGFSYNKREWLYVFLYFIMYYMVNQFVSLINFGINLLINPNLLNVDPNDVFSAISGILILQLIFSVGLGVGNFYIAKYLMTKKINLKNG